MTPPIDMIGGISQAARDAANASNPLSKEGLETLALRCESANGPDRELDAEIGVMAGFRVVDEGHPLGLQCYTARGQSVPLPRYTASLDAAITLVPDGWVWSMNTFPNAASAYCMDPASEIVRPLRQFIATAPLALTAAALRAQSHLLKGNEHG